MHYDYLIAGAGLFGAVFAHEMHKQGRKVLVVEKRDHIAGNIYTEKVMGINVHRYGAHIFHTSDEEVWNYVNQYARFNHYVNSPVAVYRDELYNLPFNMNTFHQMWGVITPGEAMVKIGEQRALVLDAMRSEGISEPRNLEEQARLLIGNDIYEKLIKGYTEKQWGRKCSELPPFIIKRLPVRFVYDNNYFNAKYQGIPVGGYNVLIDRLLEGIEVRTSTDYLADREYWNSIADKVLFTGPIDAYFDYCYGKLDYRTVRFETEVMDTSNYQGNAVVNFTDSETPYTRVIEHKHFESFGDDVYANPKTVVSREFSVEWSEGLEPYYPVNDSHNNLLYSKYRSLADNERHTIFGGRLAEYKYYDMDKIVELAFDMPLE